MLEFLTVAALMALVVVGALVTIAWLALRRIRRSRLVATGMQLAADAVLVLTACHLRPTSNRSAALRAVRLSRGHRLLRQRVTEARRAGAYLGDVPAVLPRLEADGRRIRAGLGQLVGSTTAAHDLLAQADRHLTTLADLADAVGAATRASVADESLAGEAEEAALGLRLHTAAYNELMAMGNRRTGTRGRLQPHAEGAEARPGPNAPAPTTGHERGAETVTAARP